MSDQQPQTTPIRMHATWIIGASPSVAEALAYAQQREEAMRAEYSRLVGFSLTIEQANAMEIAARSISASFPFSYQEARNGIVATMRTAHTRKVLSDVLTGFSDLLSHVLHQTTVIMVGVGAVQEQMAQDMTKAIGIINARGLGGSPSYDHWWIGLEKVERRHRIARRFMRQRNDNTRGSYTYGTRQTSYWRHTRAH